MKSKIIFAFIFTSLLAINLFFRLYHLDISPSTLNYDEAALGYNAYSLLLTGKDEFGVKYPLALRSFNDFKPALYTYLTIPFVKIFGLNQFSTRCVSAIFGTISLIFFWFVLVHFFPKVNKYLLLAIFGVLSLGPWRLHFSRVAFESNLSLCFFLAGVWLLLNYYPRKIYIILSAVFFSLALYSYHAARLAVPLFLSFYLVDPLHHLFSKLNFTFILSAFKKIRPIYLVLCLSLPIFLLNKSSAIMRRFEETNVFAAYYPYTPPELITNPSVFQNFQAHPFYYLGSVLSGHIAANFSPRNLGEQVYQSVIGSPQVISGTGMLNRVVAIFFFVGLIIVIKNFPKKFNCRLLIYWIFAGCAPAVLTVNWFHPLRSLNIYPAIEIIAVIGFLKFIDYSQKHFPIFVRALLFGFLGIYFLLSTVYTINNELVHSLVDTSGEFQPGGFREGAALLKKLMPDYQTIYIDSPHSQNYIYFLFYLQYPPENIQSYVSQRSSETAKGSLNFNFDKFVYKKYDWPKDKKLNNFIYWTSSEVKAEEIAATPGATMYKIYNVYGEYVATIITKK